MTILTPAKKKLTLGIILACLLATTAYAARVPISGSADARIKKVPYHESDVYVLKGHYGYSTLVEFAKDERIVTVATGDSESWQVTKLQGFNNMIVLKPLLQKAATNMTVITSAHIYSFELTAEEAPEDGEVAMDKLTFRLKFTYPNETKASSGDIITFNDDKSSMPLSSVSPDAWNFEYTFKGDNALRPLRVFDDGKFTYFQFDDLDVMPAIFAVDEKGQESIVNASMNGSHLIIHRTGAQFRLRDGDMESQVFNEKWPKPTGKQRAAVPLSTIKEKPAKTTSLKKKKQSSDWYSFFDVTPSTKITYN